MHHQEFQPNDILQHAIQCFWYDRKNLGEELTGFEVVPDGYAEIIFRFGSGCSVMVNGELKPLPSPFMMGLLNQPVSFFSKNELEIIGIRCFPWTVFDLLGLPSGKGGIRAFEHPIAQLQFALNGLVTEGRIEEAVTLVQQYFLDARPGIATDSLLYKAGVAMRNANGTMPVSGVASAAHATVRTLERKFRDSSGHTVKDVSGLMRFERVRNHLWTNPDANLAGLAHDMGYTDQSHLSREFKRYSGTSPAAFARQTKKGKWALSNDIVTFTNSDHA